MRMLKWNRGLRVLGGVAVGVLVLARVASASADVTTEQPGSILVWPKVVWDGNRDTIIQLTNTGNPPVHAHCFYVNAAPSVRPCDPPSSTNPAQWLETDFDLWLTKQQPTHWVVSSGRTTDFQATVDMELVNPAEATGFDPGLIPPVPLCFQGELKCIETDDAGGPTPGNKLKGEATIRSSSGDVSEYNAIAFLGNPGLGSIDIGTDLEMTLTDANPGGEYSACPDRLLVNHFAYGAPDLAFGGPVTTDLTLVPCQEDFEHQVAGKVTVQFLTFNEFEQPFSSSTTVNCWLNAPLSTLTANQASFSVLGTIGAYTRVHPNPGGGGVIGVAEEFRSNVAPLPVAGAPAISAAAAAFNLNIEGNRYDSATDDNGHAIDGCSVNPSTCDSIIIPSDSVQ